MLAVGLHPSSFYSRGWFDLTVQVMQFMCGTEFIARLRAAVDWSNSNRSEQLWYFCTNQKERAAEGLLRDGGRTGF